MTSWRNLSAELDAWAAAGRSATLWWRDDDAVAPSPELDRLLTLARARDLPLALAVIPARASQDLADWLVAQPARATLVQHGYAHQNHARKGEKKAEFKLNAPPIYDGMAIAQKKLFISLQNGSLLCLGNK